MAEKAPGRGFAGWLRELPGNAIAGMSVALIAVPQAMAYAGLAGMPPIVGLYAVALPPVAAALFASSPYLQTGPVAITALLTAGALSGLAAPGTPEYVHMGLGLALAVGLIRVLLGLLRGGWIAYLMSQPMLVGFVPAAGVLIASSQIPKAVGCQPPEFRNDIAAALWALTHPNLWNAGAVMLTLLTAVLILGGRRAHPLFPGVLAAVIAGLAMSWLDWFRGPTIGSIPSGFPSLTIDMIPWGSLPELIMPGILIALIGFTEAASISRRFASEDRVRWSANREFISQGAANIAAAVTGGMPCGGSFSRSSVNRLAGATSRMSGAITGLAVLTFLPFASALEPLPLAVLGAIVVAAVLNLIRFGPMIRIWRVSLPQAVIAWVTFAATLLLAPRIDLAVLIGVGMSIAVFLWRMLNLDVDVAAESDAVVFTPRGVLWFGTAQRLDDLLVDALAAHPNTRRLEINLSRLGRIDTTGAVVIRSVLDYAHSLGLEAGAIGVPPQSAALVARVLDPTNPPLT